MTRFRTDVVSAAQAAMPNQHSAAIASMQVMDMRQDGSHELWAEVRGENRYAIVWLAYPNGQAKTLRADSFELAGGGRSTPAFVDIANIDGDGTDDVVIRDQGGAANGYEIYELSPTSVRLVFKGSVHGC